MAVSSEELTPGDPRYAAIVALAPVAIFETDVDGACAFVNERWSQMTGLSFAKAQGHGWQDALHPEDRDRITALWRNQVHLGEEFCSEFRYLRPDGSVVWTQCRATPLRLNGSICGYLGAGADISERHLAESEAEAARREADHAYQLQTSLLATMSHEIRTPMNALLGAAELLAASVEGEEAQALVQMIQNGGASLLRLLDSILTLASLEGGQAVVLQSDFEFELLARECKEILRSQALARGLSLQLRIHGDAPIVLRSDREKLRRLILELGENAIKFTERGGVDLDFQFAKPESDLQGVTLRLSVSDSGVGLPPGPVEQWFRPFALGDASAARRHGGLGLGLAIAARIVALFGGELRAERQPGGGSSFRVRLNLAAGEAPQQSGRAPGATDPAPGPSPSIEVRETLPFRPRAEVLPLSSAQRTRLRVLAIDDEAIDRRVLELYMRGLGIDLEIAASGPAALERFQRREYDVVLLDVRMPLMDGRELARALRSVELAQPTRPRAMLVSLSANSSAAEIQMNRAAGCDAHLAKPLRKPELLGLLAGLGARAAG